MDFNNTSKDDMTMEDILSSIRKYVSEEETKKAEENKTFEKFSAPVEIREVQLNESQIIEKEPTVIELGAKDVMPEQQSELSVTSDKKNFTSPPKDRPFEKLSDALKTYGKSPKTENAPQSSQYPTIDKFLFEIAQPLIEIWIKQNLSRLTEEIVLKEIEKLKSE